MSPQNIADDITSELESDSMDVTPILSNKVFNDNYVQINDFSGHVNNELKNKNENKKSLKFLVVDDSGYNIGHS